MTGHPVISAPPAAPRQHGGETEQLLVCRDVRDTAGSMRTFVFESAEPGLVRHEPGQYLTFAFDIDGREVHRCYTVSSPPTRPHTVAITVKRVPGGTVSNWLHDHMAPGSTVRAWGPLGGFSMARHPAPAYLFLSGGSGVTPLMSMLRTVHDLGSPANVVFLHSARTPEEIPFREELATIAEALPNVRVAHVCEEDGASGWHGHRGRLTLPMLRQEAPDFVEREVFTCGPPGYMSAVRRMLATAGFPMDRYHQESFEVATEAGAPPSAEPSSNGSAGFAVRLSRSGRTVDCPAGTPVLEAAARAGVTLPSSCGQGLCGSCVATLESGSVDMRHNGGISPREAARNRILLCCSTPLEDVVIDA